MEAVVALLDQRTPVVTLEVSVTLPPWQNDSGPEAEMSGVAGSGLTTTDTDEDVAAAQ
jgi:hypothetical protein